MYSGRVGCTQCRIDRHEAVRERAEGEGPVCHPQLLFWWKNFNFSFRGKLKDVLCGCITIHMGFD